MTRKRTPKPDKNADPQGSDKPYAIGYGKPPTDFQWQPGMSGNPAGCSKRRANIWPAYCKFLAMTPAEIRKLDRSKLSLAERSALRLAIATAKGKRCSSERFARYATDRDEGRAVERVIIGDENAMPPERCEELAKLLGGAWDADPKQGQEADRGDNPNP